MPFTQCQFTPTGVCWTNAHSFCIIKVTANSRLLLQLIVTVNKNFDYNSMRLPGTSEILHTCNLLSANIYQCST